MGNVTHLPLIDVMLLDPAVDIFLDSINTGGHKKTKAYIATDLKKFTNEVGPNSMTQICTDNATNMLGIMENIVQTYPHIFKQNCVVYILDLMLEDWAKIDQFKDLITSAKRVCLYIQNHM
jgi:hypothetical protein